MALNCAKNITGFIEDETPALADRLQAVADVLNE